MKKENEMPIYEYECVKCGHVFERLQKVDEGSEGLSCPECMTGNPKKLVTRFRTNFWSSFLDNMERRTNPQKFK